MLRDPFIQAVIIAHRDWTRGALGASDVPLSVWDGVHVFESALNTVRAHDYEVELEEQKVRDEVDRLGRRGGRPRAGVPLRLVK